MWALHHPILFLLLYKDVIGLLIQAGLLLATGALIWVGTKQAKAADAQANAAIQQIKAAEVQAKAAQAQAEAAVAQVEVARSQLQAMVSQGSLNIRPIFKFRIIESGYTNTAVFIKNVGSGPAFNTKWKFVRPPNAALADQVYPIGTLAVDQEEEMPWPFDKDDPKLKAGMVDDRTESASSVLTPPEILMRPSQRRTARIVL
jgi:hypothetical protein